MDRPLILTTLEPDEAMRILAGDHPRRPLAVAISLVVGLVFVTIGLGLGGRGHVRMIGRDRRRARRMGSTVAASIGLAMAVVGAVAAASPSPSGAIGGDPRSAGQGPGLVGDPAVAILLVVAIGLIAMLGTLAYVKLTGGRRS